MKQSPSWKVHYCAQEPTNSKSLCNVSLTSFFFFLYIYTVRSYSLSQPPSWRTTPSQLATTTYSIHSQLPSISGGHHIHLQHTGMLFPIRHLVYHLLCSTEVNNWTSKVTGCELDKLGLIPAEGMNSSSPHPNWLWGPSSPQSSTYC